MATNPHQGIDACPVKIVLFSSRELFLNGAGITHCFVTGPRVNRPVEPADLFFPALRAGERGLFSLSLGLVAEEVIERRRRGVVRRDGSMDWVLVWRGTDAAVGQYIELQGSYIAYVGSASEPEQSVALGLSALNDNLVSRTRSVAWL